MTGCKPAKKPPFLVVAGFAGNHQKKKIEGRLRLPKPLHRVTHVIIAGNIGPPSLAGAAFTE